MKRTSTATVALGLAALAGLTPRAASACGCFAAPNPAVPVVQAGERILFARDGTKVVAHIEIQYEGEAEEFGWLIPMPSVPDCRTSVAELFDELERATAPTFLFNQTAEFCGDSAGIGCSNDDDAPSSAAADNRSTDGGETPVLVEEVTAGPFVCATVRADEKQPMIDWLNENRYVVPTGGEDLLDPYIGEGAFFLALKLRSDADVGDIQPIAIEYEADSPMIPLILTRLGAINDMGVLVWVLGNERAIPTNYRHVQINEEYIDWFNGAANYADVVARAVDEADGGRAFVTEYAGTSAPMVGVLDYEGRFGLRADFEAQTNAVQYVEQLTLNDFPQEALRPILQSAFPLSEEAIRNGIQPEQYYDNLASSLATYDPMAEFDPIALTATIWERIVEPTRAAGALFQRNSYLTRLFTAISPDEMTADPTFAFNPNLPTISNLRTATATQLCESPDDDGSLEVQLSDGRRYYLRNPIDWTARQQSGGPRTTVIEQMRLEGDPVIEVDNRETLLAMSGPQSSGGCRSSGRFRWSRIMDLLLIFGSIAALRWRLRRA